MTVPHDRSWWSTRQRLVVVTGHDTDAGDWLEALRDLEIAVRDVVDEWHDLVLPVNWAPTFRELTARVEAMRQALAYFREWDRSP